MQLRLHGLRHGGLFAFNAPRSYPLHGACFEVRTELALQLQVVHVAVRRQLCPA